MKNINIYIIIFLLLIIGVQSFIIFFGKGKYEKKIENYKQDITNYKNDVKKLKEQKALTDIELQKMPKEKIIVKYKEVVKEKAEAVEGFEDCIKSLEQATKDLEQCDKILKRKNKIMITGIVGIGVDQKFNLTGQVGGTINGKIYSGLFANVYLGGGGTYSVRTNFDQIINGGNFIFQTIITFGK
jgi:uncharacterized ion transporter superfamily protein YfcC